MVSSLQTMPAPPERKSFRESIKKLPHTEEIEDLPPYSNTLRLLTLCQRKREYTAALDKARRRGWEIIWLLLDGTALRIYTPTKEERRRFEEERFSAINPILVLPSRRVPAGTPQHAPDPRQSSSSLQSRTVANDSRPSLDTMHSQSRQKTRSLPTSRLNPDLEKRTPLRQYHLRHAVCMKAETYLKRDHVLRFILGDGKQFLIQLNSRSETVAWLQHMSVAAPLALDLDERPMPEPAQYPRTRRRPRTAPPAMQTATLSQSLSPVITEIPSPSRGQALDSSNSSEIQPDGRQRTTPLACLPTAPQVEDVESEEEEIDHLPPPRRPIPLRSLSSVEQARRMGIQL